MKYERITRALAIPMSLGQAENESHHQTWIIAQMVRELCGDDEEYKQWVQKRKYGSDGPDTYSWNEGIAP